LGDNARFRSQLKVRCFSKELNQITSSALSVGAKYENDHSD